MLVLKDKSDLDRLVAENIQESLTLDYKSATALGKSNQQRNELCKDVSAFANSAGGQIIYGIQEGGHHPVRVEDIDAVNSAEISREWVEQVIDSNIRPRIKDLRIQPINVAPGRVAYVITVPQATTHAPHQAPDNKYYYRQNFQSIPMEDYQIRDALRRETTAKPYVEFTFAERSKVGTFIDRNPNGLFIFRLHAFVSNKSNQPAFYSVVTLLISNCVKLASQGDIHELVDYKDERGNSYHALRKKYGIPGDFPIFKEAQIPISTRPIAIGVDSTTRQDGSFPIGYEVLTPGYHAVEFGLVRCRYDRLTIDFPGNLS